jgi:hypothetical protein
MARKLRFGVVIPSKGIAAWQAQALRHLIEAGVADLALVIVQAGGRQPMGSLLWRGYLRAFGPRSLLGEDVAAAIGGAETVDAVDLARSGSRDIDFVLSFAQGDVPYEMPISARFGVWSFQIGGANDRSGPPCFWEICRGEPTVYASLVCVTKPPRSKAVVLREGHLKIDDYFYARSVDRVCFEIAKWPVYAAREILSGVTVRSEATPKDRGAAAYVAPSNARTVEFLVISVRNALRRLFERNRREEWNIGVVRMGAEELLDGAPIENVQWFPPFNDGWTADPMALRLNGGLAVLCEEMQLRSGKGRIAAAHFDGSSWSSLEVAIETATHASYPYLFEHRGDIFCVPETFEAHEIALYRARDFPTKWERVATLMSGIAAIDATIFEHEGLFWLFCTTSDRSDTELRAFFTDDIMTPWQPHAANPLKIDVRGSRPAGPPFRVSGRLYRPAQDCSRTYGGRVVVHRILTLTPTEFREEPCAVVEPPAGTYDCGLHTLSFAGDFCVLDGKRWARR